METNELQINVDNSDTQALVSHMHTKGLTIFMTAVFMVGEMAGSGVLALPYAIEATGWIGLVLIPLCGYISSYTGDVLGECWTIVQERFPAMRGPVRYPYPAIGMLTFGRIGRTVVSVSIDFTLFGVSCVFLLLASQNMHSVFKDNGAFDLSFCYWLMIFCAILTPCCLQATPKDFKWVALGAAGATSVACVILLVLMGLDSRKNEHPALHTKVDPLSFAAAFGVICFAFGGHPTFPTFQNDMCQPKRFGTSCRIAYFAVVVLYLPVATGGFFVYGKNVKDNVLEAVSHGPALTVIQCLITFHLICSFIIVINPLCQELEEILKIPENFNYKRVILRVSVCLLVLLTVETIPRFGAILSLIGGSSTTLLAYVAPPICYLKLAYSEGPWPKVEVPLVKLVILAEIMLVGIFAGIFSTYSAIKDLATPNTFTMPCFINVTAAGG